MTDDSRPEPFLRDQPPGFGLRDRQTEYLLRDRKQGKTSLLIEWLLRGDKTDGPTGWSRCILVSTEERRQRLLRDPRYRIFLSEGMVLTFRHLRHGLGMRLDDIAFAVDDAEDLLMEELTTVIPRHQIRLVALSGSAALTELEALRWARDHAGEVEDRIRALESDLVEFLPQDEALPGVAETLNEAIRRENPEHF